MRSIHLWNVAREEFYLRGKPPASQPSPVCVKRVCRYHCPGESSSSKAPGEDTAHPDNGFPLLVLQKVPRGATGMGWSTWRTPHGYGLHLLPVLSGVKAIRARLPLLFPCLLNFCPPRRQQQSPSHVQAAGTPAQPRSPPPLAAAPRSRDLAAGGSVRGSAPSGSLSLFLSRLRSDATSGLLSDSKKL